MHFSSAFAATTLLALANGAVVGRRANSGEATFYGGNTAGGMCSFSTYTIPSGLYGTALSDSNWDNSGNCGGCVAVTGPDGTKITAIIVDQCPGCGANHLDLFPDAFAKLADPSKGVIDVTWDYVDCPITSALSLHNKEGVSAYWFSMQVVNANKRVESLEFSTNGGSTWTSTERQDYNFFECSSGSGATTVDVRVTSIDGDVVIVKNVGISSGDSVTAGSNFGSSGTSTSAASPAASSTATFTIPGVLLQEESATIIPTTYTTPTALASNSAPLAPATTSAPPTEPFKSTPEAVVTVTVKTCEA